MIRRTFSSLLFLSILWLMGCASAPTIAPAAPVVTPKPTEIATLQPAPTTTPTAVALPTSTPLPTATPLPFLFKSFSDEPIVAHGVSSTWDDLYTDPGAVIHHNGQFHMFRNGFRAWPASVQVGYVTSPDGYKWTKQGNEPVFTSKEVEYAGVAMLASSIIVEKDGTWVMYFYTWETPTSQSSGAIGRATAKQPTGPWTPDKTPVLKPGASGEWDDKHVLAPHVIRTDTGYMMYYGTRDSRNVQMIGMATSSDGINWKKYDDPATKEAPFATSDPVLKTGEKGAWDAAFAHQPRVFQHNDGWVMLYRGQETAGVPNMALGYATSKDGIQWTKAKANPVLKAGAVAGASAFWFTNALYHDGTYYLFWEIGKGRDTNIHLATYKGTLAN